jgi:hypothetical protein
MKLPPPYAWFALAALLLAPPVARAGSVNFYWDDCNGDGGTTYRRFACTASITTESAVGSFILTAPMPDFVAVEVVVDVDFLWAESVPDWWDFSPSPGACRGGALSMSFDFASLANHSCADPFGTVAFGGLANYTISGRRSRIIGVGALRAEDARALDAGVEYYGFRLQLKMDRATGLDSCAGCSVPGQLWITSIKAVGLAPGSAEDNSTPAVNHCIAWQQSFCWWPDPTKNRTWGQVKSLYR